MAANGSGRGRPAEKKGGEGSGSYSYSYSDQPYSYSYSSEIDAPKVSDAQVRPVVASTSSPEKKEKREKGKEKSEAKDRNATPSMPLPMVTKPTDYQPTPATRASVLTHQGAQLDALGARGSVRRATVRAAPGGKTEVEHKEEDFMMEEHAMTWNDLERFLEIKLDQSNLDKSKGLTASEASARNLKHGKNVLAPPKKKPEWLVYLLCYKDPFMILLMAAGILCFIVYGLDTTQSTNLYLGIAIYVVVLVTTTSTYFQGRSASKIMGAFGKLLPAQAKVVRDGQEQHCPSENLTIGDIVILASGDRVPADIRIIQSSSLKVNNTALTGETDPVALSVDDKDRNPMESHNMAFNGTLVVEGSGKGIVLRIGQKSLIGMIASLASSQKHVDSTLKKEISYFVKVIGVITAILTITFFIVLKSLGFSWIFSIINAIGILLGNLPEGLPATVTATLAITAKRLAKRNVLCKMLEHVETLGSVSTIASDKTGTLTQNRMTVRHAWLDGTVVTIGHGEPNVEPVDIKKPTFTVLHRAAAICNRAVFTEQPAGSVRQPNNPMMSHRSVRARNVDGMNIIGDASESALLRFAEGISSVSRLRNQWEKVYEVPFNSVNKWQLSVHKTADKKRTLVIKGAPERIIGLCSTYMQDGKVLPADADFVHRFEEAYKGLGGRGERVLGFAQRELNYPPEYDSQYDASKPDFPLNNMTFVGLIAMMDPPREAVPDAVKKCQTAGIKVVMVTGDHPNTAQAIARLVGIIQPGHKTRDEIAEEKGIRVQDVREEEVKCEVIPGSQMAGLQQQDWDRILSKQEIVFARMAPEHKLIIVENLQKRGQIVAVTGDGVNDSPALKKADIGVAMGSGSDVAKDAGSMILLDDNFASIVLGIELGRTIFDNLRKSICYVVTHMVPEMWPFLLNVIVGIPMGLSGVLILFIDLGTEMVPAISLAYETAELDIMNQPPRNAQKDHLVDYRALVYIYIIAGSVEAAGAFLNYALVFWQRGITLGELTHAKSTYFVEGAPDIVLGGVNYNVDQQLDLLYYAQSAWWLAIVVAQLWHIVACKTRRVSIFTQGIRNNLVLPVGMLCAAIIAVLMLYTPGLNSGLNTRPVNGWAWLLPCGSGLILLLYSEIMHVFVRMNPQGFIAKYVSW